MRKEFFKELTQKENAKFYFKDEDISTGGGVRSSHVIFKLKFVSKDNEFTIVQQTGTA
jgi:predicted alternative tryptophan synthase beta-subunit